MTTVFTKPDRHGRKVRDAEKVLVMHRERGVSLADAARTVATAGGWQDNQARIDEVCEIAEKLSHVFR